MHIRRRLVVAAVVVLTLTACSSHPSPQPADTTTPTGTRPPAGLDPEGVAAWARWQDQELDDYRYRLVVGCYCFTVNDRVVVADGQVTTLAGKPYRGQLVTGFSDANPTVDGAFEQIALALAGADDVDVRYDPVTGVPESIEVDWMTNAIDDEVSYRISMLVGTAPGSG